MVAMPIAPMTICNVPISAEAVSLEADKMVAEGTDLAKIHKNIVVKLPMTKEGLKATKILAEKGIRLVYGGGKTGLTKQVVIQKIKVTPWQPLNFG